MTATAVLNALSGALFVLVAGVVLRIAPRDPRNVAFALFAGGFGLRTFASYLRFLDLPAAPMQAAVMTGYIAWLGGAALFAVALARSLPPEARRGVALTLAGAAVMLGLLARAALTHVAMPEARLAALYNVGPAYVAWVGAEVIANDSVLALSPVLLALLALAFVHARGADATRERSRLVLMTAALATYFVVGLARRAAWADPVGSGFSVEHVQLHAAGTMFAFAVAAGWLRTMMATRDPPDARLARNAGLFIFAAILAGRLVRDFAPDPDSGAQWAIVRVVMILLLAYAVVRHQMFGIDVKLRWTISKSTVAAAFIAVFFVGSEAAQAFFGETIGSTYAGIAAAGALVFAIAPLQRAAERLAERAVPVTSAAQTPEPAARSHNEGAYRGALRIALRDRVLTADEELALARLADALHLPASRALTVRHEVERELGVRA